MLLPWLYSMRLIDHAIEPHVRPRVEVEDFRGHIIRGAACRDREAVATQAGAHSWQTPTPHCLAPTCQGWVGGTLPQQPPVLAYPPRR